MNGGNVIWSHVGKIFFAPNVLLLFNFANFFFQRFIYTIGESRFIIKELRSIFVFAYIIFISSLAIKQRRVRAHVRRGSSVPRYFVHSSAFQVL